ncbi:hypothetical protein OF83DRAFT_513177 [Amylostereum chailletii]|nr:hypothetical protein OF83DRAFT_513177 [Amylostereum chailletii]
MTVAGSLLSSEPTSIVRQPVTVGHIQLRDLVICPEERGVVNYVHDLSIMERDLLDPTADETPLVTLGFTPNTIASLQIPDSNERLLAAGGQDAELHLSIHTRRGAPTRRDLSDGIPPRSDDRARTRRLWQYDGMLSGSINNSVLLSSLSLTRSHESSAEPRVAVSNNDCTIKFFDVNVRGSKGVDGPPKRISEVGMLRLDVPVNHSSISPDGRTLLSVGDSPHVYLHALTGGARITFTCLDKLTLPHFDQFCPPSYSNAVPASFSTAFSSCGTKFAVASQEGMVAVWDVRSTKPLKVFQTDRARAPAGRHTDWYEDSWDWTRPGNIAPGWGVRNVKFSPAGHGGREIMTFTEHTSLLHVIDATTFEREEIVRVPCLVADRASSTSTLTSPVLPPPTASPSLTSSPSEIWTSQLPRPAPLSQLRPAAAAAAARDRPLSQARASHLRRARPRSTPLDPDDEAPSGPQERVRRTLGWYAARADERDEDAAAAAAAAETMDVDELESDCVVTRAPSPVPSPWRRQTAAPTRAAEGPLTMATPPHLDLAGTCFDPRGTHVYVASTAGIVEWRVRGSEKQWWHQSAWV